MNSGNNNNNRPSDGLPGRLYMCTICRQIFDTMDGGRVHTLFDHGVYRPLVQLSREAAGRQ